MVQQTTEQFWQAEARSEGTRQFIKNIKRLTTASSFLKRRTVLSCKAFAGIHPFGTSVVEKVASQALAMPS